MDDNGNNNGSKGKIDLVSLAMTGLTRGEAKDMGYEVVPMTLAESYEVNKDLDAVKDMDMEQFGGLYQASYLDQTMINSDDQEAIATEKLTIGKLNVGPIQLPMNPAILGQEYDKPFEVWNTAITAQERGTIYDERGVLTNLWTDEEAADDKGYYLAEEGGKYVKKPLIDYKNMNDVGYPFRIDENGNKFMLVLDPQSRSWVERKSDEVVAGEKLRSIWHPRKAESSTMEHVGTSIANTVRDQIFNASGTAAEMIGSFNRWAFGGGNKINSWEKWGREMQNYGNAVKSKVSEAAQQEGMFGSWRATAGTSASALTQVGMQAIVGLLTRGVGNYVTGPIAATRNFQNLVKVMGKTKATKWLSNMIGRAANRTPWTFSAAYAANGLNEEAKAAGLDDRSRMIMSLAGAAAVYASEYATKMMGGKGLVDMFDDPMTARLAKQKVGDGMRKIAREAASEGLEGMSDDAAAEVINNKVKNMLARVGKEVGEEFADKSVKRTMGTAFKKFQDGVANWQYADKPGTLVNRVFRGALPAGLEEGIEEPTEGLINSFSKMIYNEGFAKEGSSPGQGQFHSTEWEDPMGEFLAGFIGGFPMGLLTGAKKRVRLQDYGIAEIAMNMDEKQGFNFLKQLHRTGYIGDNLNDSKGQMLNMFSPKDRKGMETEADETYNMLADQLKIAYKLKNELGLDDAKQLNSIMGGDMALAKDALTERVRQVRYSEEIKTLENKLKDPELSDGERESLTKQLGEVQELYNKSKAFSDDVFSGKAVEKYKAIMAVRAAEATELMKRDLRGTTQIFEDLEKTDTWQNRDRAIEKIKLMQNFSKNREEYLEQIRNQKEKSAELKKIIEGLGIKDKNKMTDEEIDALVKTYGDFLETDNVLASDHSANMSNLRSQLSSRANEITNEMIDSSKYARKIYDNKVKENLEELEMEAEAMGTTLTDAEKDQNKLDSYKDAYSEIKSYADDAGDKDALNFMDELAKGKSKITEHGSKLDEYEGKMIQDGTHDVLVSKYETKDGVEGYSAQLFPEGSRTFEEHKIYSATDKDGKRFLIKQEEYDKAKADAKSTKDEFEYEGKKYSSSNAYDKDNNRLVKNVDEFSGEEFVAALGAISAAGKNFIENTGFRERVDSLINTFDTLKGDVPSDFKDQVLAVREEMSKLYSALKIIPLVENELSEDMKEWIGLKSSDDKLLSDVSAVKAILNGELTKTHALLTKINASLNEREAMQNKLKEITITHKAIIHNEILDAFEDLLPDEIEVDDVKLTKPEYIENVNAADEAQVIKGMQYMHYFFNQPDMYDDNIDRFKEFWHKKVEGKKVSPDGELLDEYEDGEMDGPNIFSENQGMFTDKVQMEEEMFDINNFREKKNKDGISSMFRNITYYHVLNEILFLDPFKLYNGYFNALDKFDYAHTEEQLKAINFVASTMEDNKKLVLAKEMGDSRYVEYYNALKGIMKTGTNPVNEDGALAGMYFLKDSEFAVVGASKYGIVNPGNVKNNAVYVPGSGGVGKTSFVVKTLAMLNSINNTYEGPIVIVAPTKTQLDHLEASIADSVGGREIKKYTVKEFMDVQHTFENSMVIVDEVSLITDKQRASMYFDTGEKIERLKEPYEKDLRSDGEETMNIPENNFIVFLGDDMQAPFDPVRDYNLPNFSKYIQHTNNLVTVKRTNIVDIEVIQNVFREQVARSSMAELPQSPALRFKYSDDGVYRKGVKISNSEAAFFADALRVNNMPEGKTGAVIVLNDKDAKVAEDNGIKTENIRLLQDLERTPQGDTIDEVYVFIPTSNYHEDYMPTSTKLSPYYLNRYIGTAVGRGKDFVNFYNSGDLEAQINIGQSQSVDVSEISEFKSDPEIDKNKKEALKARIEKIRNELAATSPEATMIFEESESTTEETADAEAVTDEEVVSAETVFEEETTETEDTETTETEDTESYKLYEDDLIKETEPGVFQINNVGKIDLRYFDNSSKASMPEFEGMFNSYNWNLDWVNKNLASTSDGQFLFSLSGRLFVFIKAGDYIVPYYFSAYGTSGKAVTWHYVMAMDEDGWIVKGRKGGPTGNEVVYDENITDKYPNALKELERLKSELRLNLPLNTDSRNNINTLFNNANISYQYRNNNPTAPVDPIEKYLKDVSVIWNDGEGVKSMYNNKVAYNSLLEATMRLIDKGLQKTTKEKQKEKEEEFKAKDDLVNRFEDIDKKAKKHYVAGRTYNSRNRTFTAAKVEYTNQKDFDGSVAKGKKSGKGVYKVRIVTTEGDKYTFTYNHDKSKFEQTFYRKNKKANKKEEPKKPVSKTEEPEVKYEDGGSSTSDPEETEVKGKEDIKKTAKTHTYKDFTFETGKSYTLRSKDAVVIEEITYDSNGNALAKIKFKPHAKPTEKISWKRKQQVEIKDIYDALNGVAEEKLSPIEYIANEYKNNKIPFNNRYIPADYGDDVTGAIKKQLRALNNALGKSSRHTIEVVYLTDPTKIQYIDTSTGDIRLFPKGGAAFVLKINGTAISVAPIFPNQKGPIAEAVNDFIERNVTDKTKEQTFTIKNVDARKYLSISQMVSKLNTDGKVLQSLDEALEVLAEIGVNKYEVEQKRGESGISTEVKVSGNDISGKLLVNARRLIDDPKKAKALLSNISRRLRSVTSEADISGANQKALKEFFDYNGAAIASDLENKAPYALELEANNLIEKDTGASSSRTRVPYKIAGKDSVEKQKNILKAIEIILKNLNEAAGLDHKAFGTLRFAPKYDSKLENTGDFDIIPDNIISTPKVTIDFKEVEAKENPTKDDDDNEGLFMKKSIDEDNMYYTMSRNEALEEFSSILGDVYPELVEGLLEGEGAHGKITKLGNILLNYKEGMVNQQAVYHEIAHYVLEFLVPSAQRQAVYAEMARRTGMKNFNYNNLKQRRDAAEAFAVKAQRYAADRRNVKGASRLLKRILDAIRYFLSKIGLFKNLAHEYMYKIYVKNDYRNTDKNIVVPVESSMPYDELYMRSDNFVSFDSVISHFNSNKNMAITAADKLAKFMAEQTVFPVLNSRFFKDEDTSFQDVINRIENAIRMKVMFETDKDGTILKYKKGDPEVINNPQLEGKYRLKVDTPYSGSSEPGKQLSIEVDGQFDLVPLFKYDVIEKGTREGQFDLHYYSDIDKAYVPASKNEKGIYFSSPYQKRYIRKKLVEALKEFNVPVAAGYNPGFDVTSAYPSDSLSKRLIVHVPESNIDYVYNASMMNDNIFAAMLNRYFPTLDALSYVKNKSDRNATLSDVLDEMIKATDTVARKDSDQVNPMDSMSALFRFVLMNIPVYVKQNGKWIPDRNQRLNTEHAVGVLNDLPMIGNIPSMSNAQNFKEALEAAMEKMGEVSNNDYTNDKYSVYRSIYEHFFKSGRTSEAHEVSHNKIVNEWYATIYGTRKGYQSEEDVYNEYKEAFNQQKVYGYIEKTEPMLSKEDFLEGLKVRAKHANKMLSAFISYFGSMATNEYVKAIQVGQGARAKYHIRPLVRDSIEEKKMEFENHFASVLTEPETGKVSSYFTNLFGFNESGTPQVVAGTRSDGEPYYKPAKIIFGEDGIYYKALGKDVKVMEFDANYNARMVDIQVINNELASTSIDLRTIVETMFKESFRFNNNNFPRKFYNQLSSQFAGDIDNAYDYRNLHKIFGKFYFATYANVVYKSYRDEVLDTRNEDLYNQKTGEYIGDNEAVRKYYQAIEILGKLKDLDGQGGKDSNYGKITAASEEFLMSDKEEGQANFNDASIASDEEFRYYHPNGFFEELLALADQLTAKKSRIAHTTENKKIYLDTVQTNMEYKLKNNNHKQTYREKVLDKNITTNPNGNYNPMNKNTGVSPGFIRRTTIKGGLQSGFRGKTLDNMTTRDNFDFIYQVFSQHKDVTAQSYNRKSVMIPFNNQGERNNQKFGDINFNINGVGTITGRSNGLMYKVEGKDPKIDADNILAQTLNLFSIYENAQIKSLNKWVNFFVSKGVGTFSESDIISRNDKNFRSKVNNVYKKVSATANNYMFQFAKTEIDGREYFDKQSDEVTDFDGYNMVPGEDYLILQTSLGNKIIMGHNASMYKDVSYIDASGKIRKKSNPSRLVNYKNYASNKVNVTMFDGNGKEFDAFIGINDIIENYEPGAIEFYIPAKGKRKAGVLKSETAARKILFRLFKDDLAETHRVAKNANYKLYPSDNTTAAENGSPGIKANNQYDEHWAALVMGHNLMNQFFNLSTEGTMATEMDNVISMDDSPIKWNTNNNKRSMQHSSPMKSVDAGGEFNMDAMGYSVTIGELFTKAGIDGYNSVLPQLHSVFDGQNWEHPLQSYMRYVSAGSEYGDVNKSGAIKSQSVNYDYEQGSSKKIKHAKMVFSGQSMDLAPEERRLFEIMSNPYARKHVSNPDMIQKMFETYDYTEELTKAGFKDSLWQRFLIFEEESKYTNAVKKMRDYISSQGGINGLMTKALNGTPNEFDAKQFEEMYKQTYNLPKYTAHRKIAEILNHFGFGEYIEQPTKNTNFDEAIESLYDFYLQKRTDGVAKEYAFIGQLLQKGAAIKHQSVGNTMPLILNSAVTNNVRSMNYLAAEVTDPETGEVTTQVPTDFFSMYRMHLQSENDLNFELFAETYDNTQEGIQLNPNRNVDDSTEAPMTQLMSIILAAPEQHKNGKAQEMMDIISEIVDTTLNDFLKQKKEYIARELTIDGTVDGETKSFVDPVLEEKLHKNRAINKFIKDKVRSSLTNADDSSILAEVINDPNININTSEQIQERIYQYVSSMFRKQMVKRKQESMRLVQASGNNIIIYRYNEKVLDANGKETGEVRERKFNLKDAVVYAERMLGADTKKIMNGQVDEALAEVGIVPSGLKHTVIKQARELTIEEQRRVNEIQTEAIEAALNKGYSEEKAEALGRQARTRYMIDNGLAIVERGEIVVPAPKFKKYGIPKNIRFNQLYSLYENVDGKWVNNNLADLSAGDSTEQLRENRVKLKRLIKDYFYRNVGFNYDVLSGKKITIAFKEGAEYGDNAYFDSLFVDSLNGYFKTNKEVSNKIKRSVDKIIKKKYPNRNIQEEFYTDGKPNAKYAKEIQPIIDAEIYQEIGRNIDEMTSQMANGLIATMNALKSLGVRTPSGPGSGFYADAIQFVNDNGAVGYVNTIKNLIDGSDQDADQFTLYYYSDTEDKLGLSEEEKTLLRMNLMKNDQDFDSKDLESYEKKEKLNQLNNRLMDLVFDYFNNPKNNHLTGSAINVDAQKYISKRAIKDKFPNGEIAFSLGQSMMFRKASFDGKVVGPMAQAQKLHTFLYSAFEINGSSEEVINIGKYKFRITAEQYKEMPAWIEALVNAATDNPKLMIIGDMNISFSNADVVASAALCPDEIIDFVVNNYQYFGLSESELYNLIDNNQQQELFYLFFQGEAHKDIYRFIDNTKDFRSGARTLSFQKAVHKYTLSSYDADEKTGLLKSKSNIEDGVNQRKELIENNLKDVKAILKKAFDMSEADVDEVLAREGIRNPQFYLQSIAKKMKNTSNAKFLTRMSTDINRLIDSTDENSEVNSVETNDIIAYVKQLARDLEEGKDIDVLEEYSGLAEQMETRRQTQKAMKLSELQRKGYTELAEKIAEITKAQYYIDKNSKKISPAYKQQLFMLNKYAVLGEWMRGATYAVDIDQYKIKSTHAAYKYANNLERMTGMKIKDFVNLYEKFEKAKEANATITPAEFLKSVGKQKNVNNLISNYKNMIRHSLVKRDRSHILQPITMEINGNVESVNYLNDFYEVGDLTSLLFARPDLMKKIKVLSEHEILKEEMFINHSPEYIEVLEQLMNDAGIDYMREDKWRTYFSEAHTFLQSMFFRYSAFMNNNFKEAMRDIGFEDNIAVTFGEGIDKKYNLMKPQSRQFFVKHFPIKFERDILPKLAKMVDADKSILSDESKEFVRRLEVKKKKGVSYIELKQATTYNPDDIQYMRKGFTDLPKSYKHLLSVYQLAKSGFVSNRGFLSKVIPMEYYREFSEFIEKVEKNNLDGRLYDIQNDFYEQLVANPSLNLLETQKTTKVIKKVGEEVKESWESVPPLAAYGFARLSYKSLQTKGGNRQNKRFKTTAQFLSTNRIMYNESDMTASTETVQLARDIIDINDTALPKVKGGNIHTFRVSGVEVDIDLNAFDFTLAAYLNTVLKGRIERNVGIRAKQEGIIDLEEKKQKAALSQLLVEEIEDAVKADLVYNENRGKIRKNEKENSSLFENDYETAHEAYYRVTKDWYSVLATALKDKFKDTDVLRNYIQSMQGKAIVGPSISESYSLPVALTNILNYAANSDNPVAALEDVVNGLDIDYDAVDVEVNEKLLRNRFTSVAIPYGNNRFENVVEVAYGKYEKFASELFQTRNVSVDAIHAIDAILSNYLRQGVYEPSNYYRSIGEDLQQQVFENVDKFVEYNTTAEVSITHSSIAENIRQKLDNLPVGQTVTLDTLLANFSHTITQVNPVSVTPGTYIQFTDGHNGVVTRVSDEVKDRYGKKIGYKSFEYIILPKVDKDIVRRSVMTLEHKVQNNNARRAVESFTRTIANIVPNIQYKFLTQQESNEMGEYDSMSFFKDGVVYINLDRADRGVVLHEFAHPFTIALETENEALWNKLAGLVEQNDQVMDYVKSNYPELKSRRELLREAIPTYLQMRFYAREMNSMDAEQKQAWAQFHDWLKDTFLDATLGYSDVLTGLDTINLDTADLNTITDAMLNDILKGGALSMIRSEDFAHMMPYTLRASSASKMKNINIKNVRQLFQVRGDYSVNEDAYRAASQAVNNAVNEGKKYNGVSGTYYFGLDNKKFYKEGTEIFSQEKFNEYVENAKKAEAGFFTNTNKKMLNFIKSIKAGETPLQAAVNEDSIYRSWDRRYKLDEMTDAELSELNNRVKMMMNHIGFVPQTDNAYNVKEAAAALGFNIPTNITSDAIVIVHNEGQPSQEISILTMTGTDLTDTGIEGKKTLGDAYADNAELSRKDRKKLKTITLTNTNRDVQALQNAIVGMAFSDNGVKIRKVGSVRITGESYFSHFKYMNDVVGQIQKIFSLDLLNNNLERDLHQLLNNKELYEESRYNIPIFKMLGDYIDTALAQASDDKDKGKLNDMKDLFAHVQEDHLQMKAKSLAKAVLARAQYLASAVLGNDEELIQNNYEYLQLADMYRQLTSYRDTDTKKVTPLSLDEMWLDTADRWHGQVRTWVFDSLDTGLRKAKEKTIPFQKEMKEFTKAMNAANPTLGYGGDHAHKLFRHMFKQVEVIDDATGEKKTISTHEIHHTLEDAETKALYNAGKLSNLDLEFGKWLADQMYESFVDYVMNVEQSSIRSSIKDTEEDMRKKAETIVNLRYKKGMMPVFQRTFGSALSEGKIGEAFNVFMNTAGRWYGGNLYDDYEQGATNMSDRSKFKKLLSPFWVQFTDVNKYGGDLRMKLLGLNFKNVPAPDGSTNRELRLYSQEAQNKLSFNLTNIGLYTKGASERAIHLKEPITNVNVALDILKGEQNLKGTKVDGIIQQMENYVNRQVYGELPELHKQLGFSGALNLDNFFDGTGKLLHSVHLALNPMLGAKNFSSAAFKLFTNSLTNALAGSTMFSTANVIAAAKEVIMNHKKVSAINDKYQVVNVSERDVLNHFTRNLTKKNFTETDMQMCFHYFGDHFTQLVAFVAQMKKEGTWDAHDAEGNYDYTKDARFYEVREGTSSGILTKTGKIMMDDLMRQQYLEGYHVPVDGKLTHAYSQRDENRVKLYANRFAGELDDPQYKNMASSYSLARAMMSLKGYMYNVKQHWFKHRAAEVQLGGRKVKIDGEEKVVWEPKITEGVLQTMHHLYKVLKDGEKLNIDEYRKRNLIHSAVVFGALAGMYWLVDLLTDGFDDDDDKRTLEDESKHWLYRRFHQLFVEGKGYNINKDKDSLSYWQQQLRYIIAGGVSEHLSFARPWQIYNEFNSAPNTYWWQIQNMADAVMATFALPSTLYSTESVGDALDEYLYGLSRNVPLVGSPYRFFSNMWEGLVDDYQTVTKK